MDTTAITTTALRDAIAIAFKKAEGESTALMVSRDVELYITKTAEGVHLSLIDYETTRWEASYRGQKRAVTGAAIAMQKLGLECDGLKTPSSRKSAGNSLPHPAVCGTSAAEADGSIWTRVPVKYVERAELKSGGKEIVATVVEVESDAFEATVECGGSVFRDVFETNWSAKNASIKLATSLFGWLPN
ncbi:hypothetical protein PH547_11050 [Rhizobium sp. CNPSo 3464]|uniref:hypothetical protein n=1 Tax=Rhizobium sp. CNPSo 3464 TaxID=3021406 RepID=UPI00254B8E0F|nr:hypothetical protein [Rhizobium sp. CNPSo 3464]MDK4739410.1 hypothetical protein [Rhizobium sp. CNPSo 3464]